MGCNGTDVLERENYELRTRLQAQKAKSAEIIENKNDTIALLESKLQKVSQENDGTLRRSLEKSRSEQTILQSKYEGAKQRNRILDEEVEHYKSVNCQLEDDVADWKERASYWRSQYESDIVSMGGTKQRSFSLL